LFIFWQQICPFLGCIYLFLLLYFLAERKLIFKSGVSTISPTWKVFFSFLSDLSAESFLDVPVVATSPVFFGSLESLSPAMLHLRRGKKSSKGGAEKKALRRIRDFR